MTTSSQSLALRAALLASARAEGITTLVDPTAVLPVADGGYDVSNAQSATVGVSLREHAPQRTTTIQVTTADLTDTYTLTFGPSDTYAFDAGAAGSATLAELVDDWAVGINADGTASGYVTAESDGVDTVTLRSVDRAGVGISLARGAATAEATITLEYDTGTTYVYQRMNVRVTAGASSADAFAQWEAMVIGDEPLVLTHTGGQGWAQNIDLRNSVAAVGFHQDLTTDFGGMTDDGTTGSGMTYAYRAPTAYAAPGRVAS